MITLDLKEARALVLQQQLLHPKASFKGKTDTFKAIEHLGYIQIDTLSVVARAHHHVLGTRIKDYKEDYLKSLEEEDRLVFEYWAHAASYLPMKDFRFTMHRKHNIGKGDGFWYEKNPKLMQYILDRIRAEGPLMSRDFKSEEPKPKSTAPVWSSNPIKRALHQLFMEGQLMVSRRKGFQKTYDLAERVLPSNIDTSVPSKQEYLEYLIERDVRAHGLIQAREIGHLIKGVKPDIRQLIGTMVKSGKLIEVKIKPKEGYTFYSTSEIIDSFQGWSKSNRLRILSPFDNLLIQRDRTSTLFDFKYTLECYVPAAKRIVGYFSLPLLLDTTFVGQIDLKTDRKTKTLWIKNLVWEQKVKESKRLRSAFNKSLKTFADFNNCEKISVVPELKLSPELKAILT